MSKVYLSDVAYEEYSEITKLARELAGPYPEFPFSPNHTRADYDADRAAVQAWYQDLALATDMICDERGIVNGDSPKAQREFQRESRFESRF